MVTRIAINGLGRIGRCITRAIFENDRADIELVALNGPAKLEDHAHLLKYDSVHGQFPYDIQVSGDSLVIAGRTIPVYRERDPNNLSWEAHDVDIVLECTGKFTKRDDAAVHLKSGAKKVIVSAPCDGADSTIVYGVNNHQLESSHDVISIGSCTTNALAPIAKVLGDNIGIESGFMTTIHAYTNDQNVLDGSHKDPRRARACAMSMIPTSTGAAKAIGLVLPELEGKLAGSAVRVPTPNVSLVDLSFMASRDTSAEEINSLMSKAANNELKGVLAIAPTKLVSIDFNHNSHSSIFDPYETKVVNNKFCRVISWYDNEWGFSVRMLDVASMMKV
jgi:glyceraldehyde 3-phosphate dehydrogenase